MHLRNVRLCLKYVDDLLIVLPSRQVNRVKDVLNGIHPKLQFTVELETDGKLPYLDILIVRKENGVLVHDWYMKPSAAGKILHYNSHHPLHQKLNTTLNLFMRIHKLSSPEFLNKNIERAKQILSKNGYPLNLIRKQIVKSMSLLTPNDVRNSNPSNERIVYRSLPFAEPITDNVCRLFQKGNPNLRIAKKPQNQLRCNTFSNMKQKLDGLERINTIYQIPCKGGEGQKCELSYVGQTKNPLKKRRDQHQYDLNAAVKRKTRHDIGIYTPNRKSEGKTAIITHFEETGHIPDTKNIRAIDVEPNLQKRLILESLHILNNNTINARKDVERISHTYCAIVKNRACT